MNCFACGNVVGMGASNQFYCSFCGHRWDYDLFIEKRAESLVVKAGPIFYAKNEGVRSLALSAEGEYLASVGEGTHQVMIWSLSKERGRAIQPACLSPALLLQKTLGLKTVWDVAFSPIGPWLACTTGHRKTIQLWDSEENAFLGELSGHTSAVTSVAFTPDGYGLVSGSGGGEILLWAVGSGQALGSLKGHEGGTRSLVFHPANGKLLSAGVDGKVCFWDTETEALERTLPVSNQPLNALAMSQDGLWFASGGVDGHVYVWMNNSMETRPLKLKEHTHWINTLAFSPNNRWLASGSEDGTICIWDTYHRKLVCSLKEHGDAVTSLLFSRDGRYLISGSRDEHIRFWLLETKVMAVKEKPRPLIEPQLPAPSPKDQRGDVSGPSGISFGRSYGGPSGPAPSNTTGTTVPWTNSQTNTNTSTSTSTSSSHSRTIGPSKNQIEPSKPDPKNLPNPIVSLPAGTPISISEFLKLVVRGDEAMAKAMLERQPKLALEYGYVEELMPLSQTFRPFKKPNLKFKTLKTSAEEVQTFFKWVSDGDEEAAEAILKENPSLALQYGRLTERCGRSFRHITALQYAFWALDWSMWEMIARYMPPQEAHKQYDLFRRRGTEHGRHFDFGPYLKAIRDTVTTRNSALFFNEGEEQIKFPLNILQECDSSITSWDVFPDFRGPPRRQYDKSRIGIRDNISAAVRSEERHQATSFVISLSDREINELEDEGDEEESAEWWQVHKKVADYDTKAIKLFCQIRLEQFQNFERNLRGALSSSAASEAAFLVAVLNNEKSKVADMLRQDPNLVNLRASARDAQNRLFEPFTALEYALWSSDWELFLILLPYLPARVLQEELDIGQGPQVLHSRWVGSSASRDAANLSGRRVFKYITGFQYALWAWDRSMWEMILPFLPTQAALAQYQEWFSKGTEYGRNFDLKPLIKQYATLMNRADGANTDGYYEAHYADFVSNQNQLPMNIHQEYDVDADLSQLPDFSGPTGRQANPSKTAEKVNQERQERHNRDIYRVFASQSRYNDRWLAEPFKDNRARIAFDKPYFEYDKQVLEQFEEIRIEQLMRLQSDLARHQPPLVVQPPPAAEPTHRSPSPPARLQPQRAGAASTSTSATTSASRGSLAVPDSEPSFLECVKNRDLTRAKKWLQRKRDCVLERDGQSGKTGFQWALSAFDWKMWELVLDHLTPQEALKQFRGFRQQQNDLSSLRKRPSEEIEKFNGLCQKFAKPMALKKSNFLSLTRLFSR